MGYSPFNPMIPFDDLFIKSVKSLAAPERWIGRPFGISSLEFLSRGLESFHAARPGAFARVILGRGKLDRAHLEGQTTTRRKKIPVRMVRRIFNLKPIRFHPDFLDPKPVNFLCPRFPERISPAMAPEIVSTRTGGFEDGININSHQRSISRALPIISQSSETG